MKIYRARPVDGYEWCFPRDKAVFELLISGSREDLVASSPLDFYFVAEGTGSQRDRPATFPWLASHVLIARDSCRSTLDELTNVGTIVPIVAAAERLWLFRPDVLADALDVAASEVEWLVPGQRILQVASYAFKPEFMASPPIAFRLQQYSRGPAYYRGDFVERLPAEVTGTEFECVASVPS